MARPTSAPSSAAKRTAAFDRRVRAAGAAKRCLVSRNMTEIFRGLGVKRSAKQVGASIYDFDVAPHLRPVIILAAWLCQRRGRKTVSVEDMQRAQHHINGIRKLPMELLVAKVPAAMRTKPATEDGVKNALGSP